MMLVKRNIVLWALSLLFLSNGLLYGARIEIGSVPLPPENDPAFKICARANIVPSRFLKWGYVEFVERREDIRLYELENPNVKARVKSIITSSPLLYYSTKWKEYHSEFMYTFKVDDIVCGFKAIYSPATYDDFGMKIENGGLYHLEYIPQPQKNNCK